MPDHPSQRRALRLLEEEIPRLEREIERQRDALGGVSRTLIRPSAFGIWPASYRFPVLLAPGGEHGLGGARVGGGDH